MIPKYLSPLKNSPFVLSILIINVIISIGAFDTGHHWDMSRTALSHFGFTDTTIEIMQVMNWMVDYYSVAVLGKMDDFQLLHCETLRSTNEVNTYITHTHPKVIHTQLHT